jgi:hypothetical protein
METPILKNKRKKTENQNERQFNRTKINQTGRKKE